jgi:hypothetical protein
MTTIAPDSLLQVQGADNQWHAAAVGPGVFCQQATAQHEAPAFQTVQWAAGTELVTCFERIRRMAGVA